MPRPRPGLVAGALTLAALVGGGAWWWQAQPEDEAPAQRPCASPEEVPPAVGLMSSLPLYWPIDADFAALANGTAEAPWQRLAIERCHTLVPLDTLSPDAAGTDPLAGRARPPAAPAAGGGESVAQAEEELNHFAAFDPDMLTPAAKKSIILRMIKNLLSNFFPGELKVSQCWDHAKTNRCTARDSEDVSARVRFGV